MLKIILSLSGYLLIAVGINWGPFFSSIAKLYRLIVTSLPWYDWHSNLICEIVWTNLNLAKEPAGLLTPGLSVRLRLFTLRSHSQVDRAVNSEARGPGFEPSSTYKFSFSPRVHRGRIKIDPDLRKCEILRLHGGIENIIRSGSIYERTYCLRVKSLRLCRLMPQIWHFQHKTGWCTSNVKLYDIDPGWVKAVFKGKSGIYEH